MDFPKSQQVAFIEALAAIGVANGVLLQSLEIELRINAR